MYFYLVVNKGEDNMQNEGRKLNCCLFHRNIGSCQIIMFAIFKLQVFVYTYLKNLPYIHGVYLMIINPPILDLLVLHDSQAPCQGLVPQRRSGRCP